MRTLLEQPPYRPCAAPLLDRRRLLAFTCFRNRIPEFSGVESLRSQPIWWFRSPIYTSQNSQNSENVSVVVLTFKFAFL